MYKLQMQTPNLTSQNIDKIAALFPNCITEMLDEEKSTPDHKVYKRGINFELLKQMLSPDVVDGDEAYEFTWVGKKASIVEANKPIRKTLRPCPEESKNWNDTENLYIEGDNLEVLKLLQESYLGKVKMIYIDPPYNTGNDFIYADDFMRSQDEENRQMGMYDEDENRLFKNNDSNGRFHSDWCSMMYSRLMLARNLLTDDGVIFISIDEHEVENLTKICDEVFSSINHIGTIIVKSNPRGSMSTSEIASLHEYLLIYAKNKWETNIIGHPLSANMTSEYKYRDGTGAYRLLGLRMRGGFWRRSERPNLYYPLYINPQDSTVSTIKSPLYSEEALPVQPTTMEDGTWRWNKEKVETCSGQLLAKKVRRGNQQVWDIFQKDYLERESGRRTKAKSIWEESELNYQNGTIEIKELLGTSGAFDYAKPVFLIQQMLKMIDSSDEEIVLDFFSGSATTAHAVMKLNATDGIRRKFIMVQLPEPCAENGEAYKAGYKNICEIGKERIRRAGEKIKQEDDCWKCVPLNRMDGSKPGDDTTAKIVKTIDAGDGKPPIEMVDISKNPDVGFRVFKLDDTNMKDVYYSAEEYSQTNLEDLESNIKEDRTDLDLLFGCLLDWGLPLSMPYRSEKIDNCTVHTYAPGDAALNVPDALIACFDSNVPENVIKEIAKRKPRRAVFRDSSFASSPEKINVFEIFKLYAQDTDVKVI